MSAFGTPSAAAAAFSDNFEDAGHIATAKSGSVMIRVFKILLCGDVARIGQRVDRCDTVRAFFRIMPELHDLVRHARRRR